MTSPEFRCTACNASTIPHLLLRCWLRLTKAAPAAALALVCACVALPQPAAVQQDVVTFRQQIRPSPPKKPAALHSRSGDAQMRVKADGVDYDYTNHQFAAVGNVQICYNGATIEADRGVRPGHQAVARRGRPPDRGQRQGHGHRLTDDYRDGFVDSRGVETSRLAALRANRSDGGRRCANNQDVAEISFSAFPGNS